MECVAGECKCISKCDGKKCGPDGCGGICGLCPEGDHCLLDDGTCMCLPYCVGKECGPDGCGGQCGFCANETPCFDGQCQCQPICDGYACGSDGCGGLCGVCAAPTEKCLSHICIGNGVCNDANNVDWDGCNSDGVITEFQVNTATAWDQVDPAVATYSHGGYVVVWHGTQGAEPSDIYGQRVSAEGLNVGPEFQLNSTEPGDQRQPAVAMLADDDFVAAWQSSTAPDQGPGIVGQVFASNGIKQGEEFQVSSTADSHRSWPRVGPLNDGGVVVVWETCPLPGQPETAQDGNDCGIMMRRVTALGEPVDNEFLVNLTTPGEFQVNSHAAGHQERPDIARVGASQFVITWSGQGDTDGEGIFYRIFSLPGPLGMDEWQANTDVTGAQRNPRIAALPESFFVVAWDSTDQDGPGSEVYGRVFTAGGASQSDEFKVNKYTDGPQETPAVATFVLPADHPSSIDATPAPGFVVAWRSAGQDGDSHGVFALRFKEDTTLVYH